jgi:hypothetical protein
VFPFRFLLQWRGYGLTKSRSSAVFGARVYLCTRKPYTRDGKLSSAQSTVRLQGVGIGGVRTVPGTCKSNIKRIYLSEICRQKDITKVVCMIQHDDVVKTEDEEDTCNNYIMTLLIYCYNL